MVTEEDVPKLKENARLLGTMWSLVAANVKKAGVPGSGVSAEERGKLEQRLSGIERNMLQTAMLLLKAGSARDAVNVCSDAIFRDPPPSNQGSFLHLRGKSYAKLGETKLAIEDFDKAREAYIHQGTQLEKDSKAKGLGLDEIRKLQEPIFEAREDLYCDREAAARKPAP